MCSTSYRRNDPVSHRIDSTLRGNLGSETDAMLDYLGEDYIASLCTVASPLLVVLSAVGICL